MRGSNRGERSRNGETVQTVCSGWTNVEDFHTIPATSQNSFPTHQAIASLKSKVTSNARNRYFVTRNL